MGKLLLLIIAVGYATFHSVDSESAENSCVDEQLLEAIESVQTFYRKLDRGEIFTAKLEYEEYKANCDNFRADFTSNATEFVQNFGNCAEIEEYVKFVKKDIVLLKMICNFEDNYRKEIFRDDFTKRFLPCNVLLTKKCGNDTSKDYCDLNEEFEFLVCMEQNLRGACPYYEEFSVYIKKILQHFRLNLACGENHIINSK